MFIYKNDNLSLNKMFYNDFLRKKVVNSSRKILILMLGVGGGIVYYPLPPPPIHGPYFQQNYLGNFLNFRATPLPPLLSILYMDLAESVLTNLTCGRSARPPSPS